MKWEGRHRLKKRAFCTTTEVPRRVALRTHCGVQGRCVVSEERVGGRAGTAAPQGAVCELPNPPISFSASLSSTDQSARKEGRI